MKGRNHWIILASFILLTLRSIDGEHRKFDYSSLLQNLRNAVDKNFKDTTSQIVSQSSKQKVIDSGDKAQIVKVPVGRVFKESLAKILGNSEEEFGLYEVEEVGKRALPRWLKFDHGRNKFVGIPVQSDIGNYKMEAKSVAPDGRRATIGHFEFQIEKRDHEFHCKQSSEMIIATVIFNADAKNLDSKGRLKLIRNFADFMDMDTRSIHISEGNGLEDYGQYPTSIISAGPGDRLSSRQPGITISWQARCGTDAAGVRSVAILKSSAGTGAILRSVGVEVVGWYLTERRSRVRRQLRPLAPTPTPTISAGVPKFVSSVYGTPAISASPSVSKMTSAIKPTPVKSSIITVSKTPTTQPPPPITSEEPTTVQITTKETEPPTTTEATTKMVTKPPTTKQPTEEPTTVITNKSPELINSIDNVVEFVGQPHKVPVKDDMFSDEDGNARNLKLELKRMEGKVIEDVKKDSWVRFDNIGRQLYILPEPKDVGSHLYVIRATDSLGAATNAVFRVDVKKDTIYFNNVFNVTLDLDYKKFVADVKNKVLLLEKIAEATDVDYRTLRSQGFRQGSVIAEYSCEKVENPDGDECNTAAAEVYRAKLADDNFVRALAPEFVVESTGATSRRPCGNDPGGGRRGSGSQGSGPGKWWEIVMIPIIVIAVLLLLIGLIFCCLYRRKRRFEPPKEDQNTYIYHKKPVIFMEEYEEKPDLVSLEPLILPNEKPPLQAPPYQPRASTPEGTEGAASSTVSTESDEKAPLTSSQTSPRDSPRKHAYSRSPPPYTGS